MISIVSSFFFRLQCRFTGHARGVRLNQRDLDEPGVDHFECPRCTATWTRKTRKKAA